MTTARSTRLVVSMVLVVSGGLLASASSAAGQARRASGSTTSATSAPAATKSHGGSARSGGTSPGRAVAASRSASGEGQRQRGTGDGGGKAVPRDAGSKTGDGTTHVASQPSTDSGTTRRRTRQGDVAGTAVPRGSVPVRTGGGHVIIVPGGYGFYPWGYGGLGFAGYYGGYYGGYYDPWDPIGGYSTYYSGSGGPDGALRLKVKPRDASVYVDGYYAGIVDDFNGVFQRLHIDSGAHRIEIRQPEYQPLAFDVRIQTDQTVTYHGELRRVQ